MSLSADKKQLLSYIKTVRHDLHRIPELSSEEYQTSEYIATALAQMGLTYKKAHTGLIAEIKGDSDRVVALRADFDALPIKENTRLPFASQNGNMHACGHDGHTAMLLGATKYLIEHKPKYTTRLIFQFGEEGDGGARTMIEAGALDGVEQIYALHLCPEIEKGMVATKSGALFAGVTEFDVEFFGKSVHVAVKDEGADALKASAEFVCRLDDTLTGEEKAIINTGVIKSGNARNIVSDYARAECTFRFFDMKTQSSVMDKITRLAQSVSVSRGVSAKVSVKSVYPPLNNHARSVDILKGLTEIEYIPPRYTAEDFAYYLEKTEGCMAWLGVRDQAHTSPLHSDGFDFDEDVLIIGTELFIKLANAGVN